MDEDNFSHIVLWVTGGLTIFFYLFQLIPFINVIQGKISFEKTPIFYITACYYNCLLWFIYGETIFNIKIKINYMISCALCLISIVIYLIYEIKKYLFDMFLNFIILSMSSWAIYRFLTVQIDDDLFIGKLCIVSTVIINLHSFYLIYRAKKERNINLIQYYRTIFYIFVSFSWIVYGIISTDFYIIINYIIGIITCLIQISFYLNYKNKYLSFNEKYINSSRIVSISIPNDIIISNRPGIKANKEEIQQKDKPVKIVG